MIKRLPALIFVLLGTVTTCVAQLTVVNPHDRIVSLAMGYYVDKGLFKGWNTKGWVSIAPHDSVTMLPAGIAGGEFYYYGRIAGCDQTYSGNYALFIHPTDAFAIAGAANATPLTLNEGVQKAGFLKVVLPPTQRQYRLRLPAVNCTEQGRRVGEWLVYLDRDKEPVPKPEQASFVRRLTYQQDRPTGVVRDYFWPTNKLQWEGKLTATSPAVPTGTCITYDETGRKREEVVYRDGQVTGAMRRWDATGKEMVVTKKYRTVRVLAPQQGYLVSYYNSGKSRTVIPVTLPANTVSWYYEFSAFRDKAQLQAAQAKFQLVAELSRLVDNTGTLKLAIGALTTPPGGDICNVYVMPNTKESDLFEAKQEFSYLREGTRSSLTSAVVPVTATNAIAYLGLHNPDNLNGIHYAIEVVAIVEEKE